MEKQTAAAGRRKGILFMILGSLCFALMSATVKMMKGAIPLFQLVLVRFVITLAVLYPIIRKQGISLAVEKKDRLVLFIRCFLGFVGVLLLFYANTNMPLAESSALVTMYPLFVIFVAFLLLGEPLTAKKLLAVAVGFAGVLLVVRPSGNFSPLPALAAIATALCSAITYTLVRKLSGRVDGLAITFYFSILSVICVLPFSISAWRAPTPGQWGLLLLISFFSILGLTSITKAYQSAPASEIALFDYTGVLASPLLGFLLFGEAISPLTLLGMGLIVAAGYYASLQRR